MRFVTPVVFYEINIECVYSSEATMYIDKI